MMKFIFLGSLLFCGMLYGQKEVLTLLHHTTWKLNGPVTMVKDTLKMEIWHPRYTAREYDYDTLTQQEIEEITEYWLSARISFDENGHSYDYNFTWNPDENDFHQV